MRLFCAGKISVFQLSTYPIHLLKRLADDIASAHEAYQGRLVIDEISKYINFDFDFGVNLRAIKGATVISKCERLKCGDFWYQQITKISSRVRENIAVRNQQVGGVQPFCSDETFEHFIERQASRGSTTYKNLQANLERAASQQYLMAKAASRKAFESNLLSVFITLGLDGRFHSSSKLYQGKTFDDGYAKLSLILKSLLEHLSKYSIRGIDFYGVRCVEVHEDGCPHFHINVFIRPDLLSHLKNKLRALHYEHSIEQGQHFDRYEGKIVQVRSRGSIDDYSKSIAYIFKGSYAGRKKDKRLLQAALRQKAVISVYGKHQYELIGMNGKASIIKEVSKRLKVCQVASDLGLPLNRYDRRLTWLNAIGCILFSKAKKYTLIKECVKNRYGETVKRNAGLLLGAPSSQSWVNYSFIILAVICNSSREELFLCVRAGEYSSACRFLHQIIRAPPKHIPSLCSSSYGWS